MRVKFQRPRLRLLAFALIAFGLPDVRATEWIVDQKNPAADDKNAGNAAHPFQSISAAVAKAKAGDKISVHGGAYREVVTIKTSGTADAPIVLQAAPGEIPVIKGSDVIRNWSRDTGGVWKAKIPDPPRVADAVKGAIAWHTKDIRQVFTRDGVLFEGERLLRVRQRDKMIEGSFFCDPKAGALYVWLPDSASPNEHPPEAAVRGAWLYVDASHIVVRGLQMRHASTTAIANWPAVNLKGNDITLEDCQITWGDFVGLSVNGSHIRVRNSLFACHGDSGLGGTGEHNTIEGCRVVYNNVDRYNPEWHAGGAKFIPNFRHSIVRHNEFAHNAGTGLWFDSGCDDNVIDGNLSHDNEGPGIMVEISTGNIVSNNICYSNRNHLSGPYRDEKGVLTEQNASENRIAPSRFLKIYDAGDGRGIYISSAPGTKVLHNTVYLNEAEGICVESPPRLEGAIEYRTRDYTVANNISVFNKGSQLTLRGLEGTEKIPHLSDHNLLFATGAVLAKYGWEGPRALTMADWQKASDQDAHSLDADPRFALAAMDDFRLLPNSPALRSGKYFAEANRDFFGRARHQEKPAIGACEEPGANYPQPVWQSLSEVIHSTER